MSNPERLQAEELSGIIDPLMTPFLRRNTENERSIVDTVSQHKLIKKLIEKGVHSIFLGSNAGEGRQMDPDNWLRSIKAGIDSVNSINPNIPVVVGVLREDMNEVIDFAISAKKFGARAIVYSPGYTNYNMYLGLKKLISETGMSIILYNNPEFQPCQVNIPFKFIEYAVSFPNVIGIKDTSRDLKYFINLLTLRNRETFHVFQGDTDTQYLDEQLGCIDGMVPVQANIAPDVLVTAWNGDGTQRLKDFSKKFDILKQTNGGTLKAIKRELAGPAGIFTSDELYHGN
jgi:dihydrodipicolinate synthase/N-acetylneuraminate lyase